MTLDQQIRLSKAANSDLDFQNLLRECHAPEPEYKRIMQSLKERDRETIDRYIYLCEVLEFRKTSIAYLMIP